MAAHVGFMTTLSTEIPSTNRFIMVCGGRVAAIDPLLALLQRYQVERKAFDDAVATEGTTDQDWDRIAETTWSRTQDQIIELEPPATTAAGALLALDHVLQSDDLFFDRSESVDLQMLWLLIKAARDYIARASATWVG
jgi:hypothetical protein